MSIARRTQRYSWLLLVLLFVAVSVGPKWLTATEGPGDGQSFLSLQSPFTQDLFATTANLPVDQYGMPPILGGVAFTTDGRVWSAECTFLGTRLHRFSAAATTVHG